MQGRPEKYYPVGDGDFSKGSLRTTLALQKPPQLSLQQEKGRTWGFEGNNRCKRVGRLIPLKKTVTECEQPPIRRKPRKPARCVCALCRLSENTAPVRRQSPSKKVFDGGGKLLEQVFDGLYSTDGNGGV